jgi:hypothetical protein
MRHLLSDKYEHSEIIDDLLNAIADRDTSIEDYRASFYSIGKELGLIFRNILPNQYDETTLLACASEDADWLANGFMNGIGNPMLPLAVFWGVRKKLSNGVDVTSIVRTYRDDLKSQCENLIIIKSIISSSCVVKTQLLRLISDITPNAIYIIASVMYKDAENNLCMDFPREISSKFKFITFAIDDEINEQKEIIPGVGGMVYPRLGLGNESQKNSYMPKIIINRMA